MHHPSPKGRQQTQIALQRAVARLCLARSPGSISVKEIAEGAGVTAGLVHYYYKTKDDLIGATLVMLADDILAPIDTEDPREIAQAFLEGLAAEPSFARIGSWMILNGPNPRYAMVRFPLADRLKETMGDGDDCDIRIAAALSIVLAAAFFSPLLGAVTGAPYAEIVATMSAVTGDLIDGD